jgi:hypothetical protein
MQNEDATVYVYHLHTIRVQSTLTNGFKPGFHVMFVEIITTPVSNDRAHPSPTTTTTVIS